MTDVVLLLIRLFLAGIFLVAGIAKLFDIKGSERAVRDFGVMERLVKPAALILPIVELIIGIMLIPVSSAWYGAAAALFLLVWFTAGMAYQIWKGNSPECHCFGKIHSEPVGAKSLIRNVIFAVPAIAFLYFGRIGSGLSVFDRRIYTSEALAALALFAIAAVIVLYLKSINDKQSEILRRLEQLEASGFGEHAVERLDAGDPRDSLPIGAVFPDFSLPDLNGEVVTLADIRSIEKPLLLFFVAPSCEPCRALVPEITEWIGELKDRVEFVFASRGSAAENSQKFDGLNARILLQKDRELGDLVHARWTPSAMLVNIDGRVASRVAAGDQAIRGLVHAIRDGSEVDGAVAGSGEMLPEMIGKPLPHFALKDINGNTITPNEMRGSSTLLTFWSMTCPHCQRMMDDLRKWESSRDSRDPKLVIFSDGNDDEHRRLGISSPVVIDKAYETSARLGMSGTPSAVLVSAEGRFISETAVGAANIWSLVGRRNDL